MRKICDAIAMGLNDEEAAAVAGISDVTLTVWRRDKAFVAKIKNAVAVRLYKRLQRIEAGADGWQSIGWLLERLYPTRFAKPEIQLSFNNNYTQNVLSISISGSEAKSIEAQAQPIRASVQGMFERYRPQALSNGETAKPVVEIEAAEVCEVPIERKPGDEQRAEFWAQFVGDRDRAVEHGCAEFVVRTIVGEVLGAHRVGQVNFGEGKITVGDCLDAIDRKVGVGNPAGWQATQRKAGF